MKVVEFTAIEEPEPPVGRPEPLCTDPSELEDPVQVEWSCGLAVGPPCWQGTEIYESDECPGEGTAYVERDELDDKAMFHCDCCGQFMEDSNHYEVKKD
jgi:hypothetical protein